MTTIRAVQSPGPKESSAKPKLVLRVGVTGHRDLPLAALERIKTQVKETLRTISHIAREIHQQRSDSGLPIYSDETHALRLISPLAVGADRLVAKEAIGAGLGFKLQCPIPFSQDEYEKDFKPTPKHPDREDTTEEFVNLLKEAGDDIVELDGRRESENEAYEAVGRLVLRQCDVLIAIWDETREELTGGTRQIVKEALGYELPTIWISAREHVEPRLLHSIDNLDSIDWAPLDKLSEALKRIFLYQADLFSGQNKDVDDKEKRRRAKVKKQRGKEIQAAEDYFAEPPTGGDSGHLFQWYKRVWSFKLSENPEEDPPKPNWEPPFAQNQEFRQSIAESHHRADTLSNYYGGLHRSSFVLTYLLGAFAVLFAFLGFYADTKQSHLHYLFYIVEGSLISWILFITWQGWMHRWHQRWMDYRLLAESLRHVQILAPLGRITLSFKVPAHLQPGDFRNSWFNWYFRAITREGGLVPADFNSSYPALCKKVLLECIDYQIGYHRKTHRELKRVAKRSHRFTQGFFLLAGIACVIHLAPHPEYLKFPLSFLTIVLPAFSAALAAISHHAEFERLALRSNALAQRLVSLRDEVNKINPISSKELGRTAEAFSEVMFSENLDWRFAFLEKNITLPT